MAYWDMEDYVEELAKKTIDEFESDRHGFSPTGLDEDMKESLSRRGRMLKEENGDKKYELTSETMRRRGHTLHRIRALKDFGNVEKGDIGGWIESERNLSHEGNCWVDDEAMVYEDAKVCENALVYGHAKVYGEPKIFGNAHVHGKANVTGWALVYGHAKVYGDAWLEDDAQVFGNAKVYGDTYIYGNPKVDYEVSEGEIEESRRPRGRILKEAHRNHTDFIPYTMRQYYNEYDKKWHPCVVYINSSDNGEWWIECFDEWGTNELGWDYEKFTKNGTSKCDPEEAKRIEDIFISDSKEYGNVPLRKVTRLRNFGSGNNYIGKM